VLLPFGEIKLIGPIITSSKRFVNNLLFVFDLFHFRAAKTNKQINLMIIIFRDHPHCKSKNLASVANGLVCELCLECV